MECIERSGQAATVDGADACHIVGAQGGPLRISRLHDRPVGGAEVVASDADICHPRVALLITSTSERSAVVGDHGKIDVRLLSPELGGLEYLVLPGLGCPFRVER